MVYQEPNKEVIDFLREITVDVLSQNIDDSSRLELGKKAARKVRQIRFQEELNQSSTVWEDVKHLFYYAKT